LGSSMLSAILSILQACCGEIQNPRVLLLRPSESGEIMSMRKGGEGDASRDIEEGASSSRDLSVGETPVPERTARRDQREGAGMPPRSSPREDQPRSSGARGLPDADESLLRRCCRFLPKPPHFSLLQTRGRASPGRSGSCCGSTARCSGWP